MIEVIETFHPDVPLRSCYFALIPQGFLCASIGPQYFAVFGLDPGVVIHSRIRAEELDGAKAIAHVPYNMETVIDFVGWVRQSFSYHQNPPANRWRHEKMMFGKPCDSVIP